MVGLAWPQHMMSVDSLPTRRRYTGIVLARNTDYLGWATLKMVVQFARVAESVDAGDSKSPDQRWSYEFESRPGYRVFIGNASRTGRPRGPDRHRPFRAFSGADCDNEGPLRLGQNAAGEAGRGRPAALKPEERVTGRHSMPHRARGHKNPFAHAKYEFESRPGHSHFHSYALPPHGFAISGRAGYFLSRSPASPSWA